MMHQMHQMKKNRNSFSPYSAMSSNSHHGDSKMDTKKMMKNDDYSSSSYNSDNAFDMFSDMFDSYEQKHHMEAKIGNMTCVMRELSVLDASNNIDVQAMKRDIQKYTMPSEWFKNKYEHLLDTCYEMATNLPAEIAENSVITG